MGVSTMAFVGDCIDVTKVPKFTEENYYFFLKSIWNNAQNS